MATQSSVQFGRRVRPGCRPRMNAGDHAVVPRRAPVRFSIAAAERGRAQGHPLSDGNHSEPIEERGPVRCDTGRFASRRKPGMTNHNKSCWLTTSS